MKRALRLWSYVASEGSLRAGEHVHRMGQAIDINDEVCAGGDSECPLWQQQLTEAMEAWSGS